MTGRERARRRLTGFALIWSIYCGGVVDLFCPPWVGLLCVGMTMVVCLAWIIPGQLP